MGDPRVRNMDHFTPTVHTNITPTLDPSANSFQRPFTVCIIGASGAIGAGVAKSYARAGCSDIILAGRDLEALNNVSKSLSESISTSPKIHIQHCDIAIAESVRALAEFASSTFETLDAIVLVSGASGSVELRITDGSPTDGVWASVFGTNALGTYHVAHYFVPLLLKSQTKAFMVVGSIAACITKGIIANTKYCVSKFAQARIVESVAEQFKAEGLLAVSVHPGAVESKNAIKNSPKQFLKYLTDDPDLCGAFCVWLTRDPSQFQWLSGRLVSATWDPEQLLSRKDDIVKGDLLKFEARTTLDQ
ncbi:putative short-chain dehydrogenases/reductase [Talaromyces proteolyticus]|uniref:Short-chain dehydrogenases/reductase n=1 Tax=Talaromyces proteolyticus TaxID=1131652 RepID=A0AAD4KCW6_9EURO|nr:putative short-chain dehydrogenases/reductase [Talaromyces proteolyticus]KAH8688989.1 putative short-chain dehydrogenases/reductase [Talaromyces proteolyticus]